MREAVSLATVLMLFTGMGSAREGASRIDTEIIGSFAGFQSTIPLGINNRGDVVGLVGPTGTMAGWNAFLWTREGGFQLLARDGVATDINNRGDVTGYRYDCIVNPDGGGSCTPRGFVWNASSGFADLGTFVPNAINNRGDMAGECSATTHLNACDAKWRPHRMVLWPGQLRPDCQGYQ